MLGDLKEGGDCTPASTAVVPPAASTARPWINSLRVRAPLSNRFSIFAMTASISSPFTLSLWERAAKRKPGREKAQKTVGSQYRDPHPPRYASRASASPRGRGYNYK